MSATMTVAGARARQQPLAVARRPAAERLQQRSGFEDSARQLRAARQLAAAAQQLGEFEGSGPLWPKPATVSEQSSSLPTAARPDSGQTSRAKAGSYILDGECAIKRVWPWPAHLLACSSNTCCMRRPMA
mmetsp:Transcript_52703/g.96458  ORF Transcript_52703/g.96458 Transcript_52703/m.96458 type:complete len:130 (-) Transcript_52703:38-427(-)